MEHKMNNNKIIQEIEHKKIIVIVRGIESDKLIHLAEAMYDAGIRFLEITYSANKKISDEETFENIRMLSEHFNGRMHIGAGTVLNEKQVELTKLAGGEYIISPDTNINVIKKTKEMGMLSIPGALTPSEIQKAHNAGADFVKIFPITNMGIEYVKAVKSPFSNIKILAVGGINEDNILDYLEAGVCGFGIGSNIIPKSQIDNNNYMAITELAKKYVSVVEQCQII